MGRSVLVGVVATAALSTVLSTTATPSWAGEPRWADVEPRAYEGLLTAVDPSTGTVHVAGTGSLAFDSVHAGPRDAVVRAYG